LDIHVCHCLNSKAQGVFCDSKQPINPNGIISGQCLFVDNYLSKGIYKMIQFNYLLSHWVSAELLIVDNSKVKTLKWNIHILLFLNYYFYAFFFISKHQANLIVRFLKIAKICEELCNYSTIISIYDGLQNVTVRNLSAWQLIPSKSMAYFEKMASFKVSLANCLKKTPRI
jgi:hypothetical protein